VYLLWAVVLELSSGRQGHDRADCFVGPNRSCPIVQGAQKGRGGGFQFSLGRVRVGRRNRVGAVHLVNKTRLGELMTKHEELNNIKRELAEILDWSISNHATVKDRIAELGIKAQKEFVRQVISEKRSATLAIECLGFAKDDPAILGRGAQYLKRHS
jgi:hypothetical protein